jgi:hypothetical protein
MRLSEEDLNLMKTIARQFPAFADLLTAWRNHELEALAQSSVENFGTIKGRVQLLTEMQQKTSLL